MKLILTGGGVDKNAEDAYSLFSKLVNGGKVLYIPLAEDEMSLCENFEWFVNQMKPYAINNIDMVSSAEELTTERLNSADGIFIGGGNAFQLLYLLKNCEAYDNLKKIIKSDKVVFGLSAGTTIFGKDINSCLRDDLKIVANDSNKIGLTETSGFNIIKGFSFFVHYQLKESQLKATEEKVQRILNLGTNVICLPESTNLFITEKGVSVFGKNSAEVITPEYRKIIKPNEKVLLNLNVEL